MGGKIRNSVLCTVAVEKKKILDQGQKSVLAASHIMCKRRELGYSVIAKEAKPGKQYNDIFVPLLRLL